MFCKKCGEQYPEGANFCSKCGFSFQSQSESMTSKEISGSETKVFVEPEVEEHKKYEPQRDSGIVTVFSVIGFIFGLIGMLMSFTPLIGTIAFFISIPALVVSLIGLFIAFAQNAKRTFAITAVTICCIGIVFSYWQNSAINSFKNKFVQKTQETRKTLKNSKSSAIRSNLSGVASSQSPAFMPEKFFGVWEYDYQGVPRYFKVTQLDRQKFLFFNGLVWEEKISWNSSASIRVAPNKYAVIPIKMKIVNGKLIATFVSFNFLATHGTDTRCKLTLTPLPDDKLRYIVDYKILGNYNSVGRESYIAHRTSKWQ